MVKKDEKLVLEEINNIISELKSKNINIKFLGFVDKYTKVNESRIKLLDIDYNCEGVIWLHNLFKHKMWTCQFRRDDNLRKTKRDSRLTKEYYETRILEIINNIPDYNIKFLGFVGEFKKRNGAKIKLIDLDYNETEIITLDHFLKKEYWSCHSRTIFNRTGSPRISEEKIINHIEKTIIESKSLFNLNLKFLGFKEEYKGIRDTIIVLLDIDRNESGTISLMSFLNNKFWSCPGRFGGTSLMENRCKLLIENLISDKIIEQKRIKITPNKLTSRKFIKIDFYIPSLKVAIEYNGGQHYEYKSIFHSDLSKFIDQVNRDLLLRQYCKDNGIKLLEISYLDNNRLEEVIEDFILKGINTTTPCHPKLPLIKI